MCRKFVSISPRTISDKFVGVFEYHELFGGGLNGRLGWKRKMYFVIMCSDLVQF